MKNLSFLLLGTMMAAIVSVTPAVHRCTTFVLKR